MLKDGDKVRFGLDSMVEVEVSTSTTNSCRQCRSFGHTAAYNPMYHSIEQVTPIPDEEATVSQVIELEVERLVQRVQVTADRR